MYGDPLLILFGEKYYVSFIDDRNKFTWIYLLKHKSEVFSIFHEFQQLVELQFSMKNLAIQSDWGVSTRNSILFSTNWRCSPCFLSSCAPAEWSSWTKASAHFFEVDFCLFAHGSMPLKFCDEAFLATTYLINRAPSKIIDFATPPESIVSWGTWLLYAPCFQLCMLTESSPI